MRTVIFCSLCRWWCMPWHSTSSFTENTYRRRAPTNKRAVNLSQHGQGMIGVYVSRCDGSFGPLRDMDINTKITRGHIIHAVMRSSRSVVPPSNLNELQKITGVAAFPNHKSTYIRYISKMSHGRMWCDVRCSSVTQCHLRNVCKFQDVQVPR